MMMNCDKKCLALSCLVGVIIILARITDTRTKIVSEYDQEIPQS